MSSSCVQRSIYDLTSWLKSQNKICVQAGMSQYQPRRVKIRLRTAHALLFYSVGSCRQRKPIQLLNGSNWCNFETTLPRKIPPLTLEGLKWIPSKTHQFCENILNNCLALKWWLIKNTPNLSKHFKILVMGVSNLNFLVKISLPLNEFATGRLYSSDF